VDLDLQPPRGGFYAFVGFSSVAERLEGRGIQTSSQLADALLEQTGVVTLPGEAFGRPPSDLWIRLAFVDFDGAVALEASREFDEDEPLPLAFVDRHCAHTLEAIRRICAWAEDL
jgi:aspartate aminotransferase